MRRRYRGASVLSVCSAALKAIFCGYVDVVSAVNNGNPSIRTGMTWRADASSQWRAI